jgi:Ca-activated chloride channel family protein
MAESLGVTFRSLPLLAAVLIAPLLLAFLIAREHHRVRVARRFISERLRGVANPLRAFRPYLVSIGLLAATVALAGPRMGFTTIPIEERETNRVLAIDVSQSMAAGDVGASRLDTAKALARRIIDAQPGRVGLVVFEMRPEVVSPLTNDADAVVALLDSIQPGELGDPGTDLAAGLTASQRLLEADPNQKGDIVLISDGEDQGSRLAEALGRLRERGTAVSTITLGSSGGSTIPRGESGGELRDDNGDIVFTYARPQALQQIAKETGGRAYVNPVGAHELDTLAAPPAAGAARMKNIRVPVERYQWPLAFACVFLLFGSFVNRGAE